MNFFLNYNFVGLLFRVLFPINYLWHILAILTDIDGMVNQLIVEQMDLAGAKNMAPEHIAGAIKCCKIVSLNFYTG